MPSMQETSIQGKYRDAAWLLSLLGHFWGWVFHTIRNPDISALALNGDEGG